MEADRRVEEVPVSTIRGMLVFMALCFSVMAMAFWFLRSEETLFPSLWPALYGAASASCAVNAVWPSDMRAIKTSGATVFMAATARVAGVLVGYDEIFRADVWFWRATLACAVYALLAMAVAMIWTRLIIPWAANQRQQQRRGRAS
jgi:hypothetical protein